MAGGMGVRKNTHIENWASYRENCEHYFKFSRANFARLGLWGFAVPIAVYALIVREYRVVGHPIGLAGERGQYDYFGSKKEK